MGEGLEGEGGDMLAWLFPMVYGCICMALVVRDDGTTVLLLDGRMSWMDSNGHGIGWYWGGVSRVTTLMFLDCCTCRVWLGCLDIDAWKMQYGIRSSDYMSTYQNTRFML